MTIKRNNKRDIVRILIYGDSKDGNFIQMSIQLKIFSINLVEEKRTFNLGWHPEAIKKRIKSAIQRGLPSRK